MAERLRSVAQLTARSGVVLLAEETDIVAQGEEPLEQGARLPEGADGAQRVDHPEAAGQKGALRARQSVDVPIALRVVAHDQPVHVQLLADGVHGAHDSRVVRWQEPETRDLQERGVETVRPVELGERPRWLSKPSWQTSAWMAALVRRQRSMGPASPCSSADVIARSMPTQAMTLE